MTDRAAKAAGSWLTINGTRGEALAGTPLRDALRLRGIVLPSVCGGRGLCGMCRVKVVNGGGELTESEQKRLAEEEKLEGIRLACRVAMEGEIEVALDEGLLKASRIDATVKAKTLLNHDTVRLTLALEGLDFSAGQYVQLEIKDEDPSAPPFYRAYSLASPPSRKDSIDLIIRRVPEGRATAFIHDRLKVGESMKISGPHGNFRLKPTLAPALMIAGGSGISPFQSMLLDAAEKGSVKKMALVYGAVSKRDLYDLDLFASLEQKLTDFRFVPTLSSPCDDDGWTGETGLVTDVAGKLFPDMTGMEAYLCGSPGMIDACVKRLMAMGIPQAKIYFDKFG